MANHCIVRQQVTAEMVKFLGELKKKVTIGFVGGSDLVKISEQLTVNGGNGRHFTNNP
jgi:phosphomannomutase